MFSCGYCGKEFETVPERIKCEVVCCKREEEQARKTKCKELIRIKNDRNAEITNEAKCLIEQICAFHSDYDERCDIELASGNSFISNYISLMDALRLSRFN